jgi:exopolysaccharide biosynthesis protein
MNTVFKFLRMGAALSVFFSVLTVHGQLTIGEWTPTFKGVDLARGTNVPVAGGEIQRLQAGYAVRIDLTDPDVEIFTTPQNTNYIANLREVAGYTVSDFLRLNDLQVAINANYFAPGTYYLPPATPMDVFGLAVSQGTVVSEQQSSQYAATITFNATNFPTFIRSNWPPASVEGVYNAISGNFPVLVGGTNVGRNVLDLDPRTVFGLSEDRRYLFILAIDGRQFGYSEGANFYECGVWMKALGAHDAINVDGGGSTMLVVEDSTGVPLRINRSSAVADSGNERTVGSHFGIYAKPVPGFINDVVVVPDDISASISWTTTTAATSEILYGTSLELGSTSGVNETEQTTHTIELSGLTPETGYYYQIKAVAAGQEYLSPTFYFLTTNYVITNLVFDVTNSWKFSSTPLDGVNWTATNYNDADWTSGPGLLWADRLENPNVQPRNTPLPINTATGYPYITYYFRTHFNIEAFKAGSFLLFSAFVDDGAVFYLNGERIHNLRVPDDATSSTLATGFPCDGNAICVDEFKLGAAALPSLKEGDNVLAVELHNYNARSADVTFGLRLNQINQIEMQPPVAAELVVSLQNNSIEVSWEGAGGILESASDPAGPWNEIEEYTGNRVTIQPGENYQFFRLKR